jgi:hypothetical protein
MRRQQRLAHRGAEAVQSAAEHDIQCFGELVRALGKRAGRRALRVVGVAVGDAIRRVTARPAGNRQTGERIGKVHGTVDVDVAQILGEVPHIRRLEEVVVVRLCPLVPQIEAGVQRSDAFSLKITSVRFSANHEGSITSE